MVLIVGAHIKPPVGLALLCLFLLAILISTSPVFTALASNRVEIKNTGAVYVKIIGEVEEGLNEIFLPIKPISISLEVYVNDTLIPSILVNNSVYIPSPGKGLLTIKYVANTTIIDGKSVLEITSAQELTLIIEPGVILLSLLSNIVKTYYENSNLAIVFYGPTKLEYTITTVSPTPITPTTSPKIEEIEAPISPFQTSCRILEEKANVIYNEYLELNAEAYVENSIEASLLVQQFKETYEELKSIISDIRTSIKESIDKAEELFEKAKVLLDKLEEIVESLEEVVSELKY